MIVYPFPVAAVFHLVSFIMRFDYYSSVSGPVFGMLRNEFFSPDIIRHPYAFVFSHTAAVIMGIISRIIISISSAVGISSAIVMVSCLFARPVDTCYCPYDIGPSACYDPKPFDHCQGFSGLIPVARKTSDTHTRDQTCDHQNHYDHPFHIFLLF